MKVTFPVVHFISISTYLNNWLKGVADKGLSIYYVSSYNKAGSVRMLTNAYLREQGFIQKLMS